MDLCIKDDTDDGHKRGMSSTISSSGYIYYILGQRHQIEKKNSQSKALN